MSGRRGRVAIAGCGLIGGGWAALFLAHGYDVVAWDPVESAREAFAGRLARPLAQLRELGVEEADGKLTIHDTLAQAVAGAELVQENAPEQIMLKRSLYAEIEAAAPPDAIIASSTSALTWSDLSTDMSDPRRLITAHPFNPLHLIPLVELYGVDEAVLSQAEGIYRSVGRYPVRLKKEAVGHIANRLASALWREAVHLVAEGIADVNAVDAALVNGPGLRWSVIGAHMAYHLGGGPGGIRHYLAHLGPSQVKRWQTLGQPVLDAATSARLIAGLEEEAAQRSVAEIEEERDAMLIRALRAREAGRAD